MPGGAGKEQYPRAQGVSLVLAVGELVWDIFPDRRVLGGAPMNVAYHLGRLGVPVRAVTRVGADSLGTEASARLRELGVSLTGVQQDKKLPTGQVRVTLDSHQEPHFDIVAPVAWDAIDPLPALAVPGQHPFALVFGTLAQRDPRSRETIRQLRQRASLRCYDVNLRPPFTTQALVEESLASADLVKLNGQELTILAEWLAIAGDKKNIAKALCSRYDLTAVAVTEGKEGAWLMAGGHFFASPGIPVTVVDTVGAGDAFFAALIAGYLHQRPWPEILQEANRHGAYVASRQGATPPMRAHC